MSRDTLQAEALYNDRLLSFYEACSAETLRNALLWLCDAGAVRREADPAEGGAPSVRLLLTATQLEALVNGLARYRKPPPAQRLRNVLLANSSAASLAHVAAEYPLLAKM